MSMVDDAERPVRANERTSTGMSGRTPENDPLAELARLIGQDDPFRGQRADPPRPAAMRETEPQRYVESPDSAPGWLTRQTAARRDEGFRGAPAYEAPHEPYDDPAHPADQQHTGFSEPTEHYQAAEYDAAYDPAHSDEPGAYYGDENRHPDEYAEAEEPPARRRGLVAVAALVGLAVLGTGGVFAYRSLSGPSGSTASVPIIKAPDAPAKVAPPAQAADTQPGKQIYDRVSDKGQGDKLAPAQEEPIDVKAGNPRSGIGGLLAANPPGNAAAQPPAQPQAAPAPAGPEPKKVKTVPIRPDQTTGTTPPARATAPAPNASAPMRITGNQPQTPPARNPAVEGGFVVQVASQRSEADAQASFRSLQTKYPSVLGARQAIIRKADLGEKGTFYRAQIGPFATMEQANELCSSLKSAGGQCVVAKN
jgi:SPOR domain